MTRRTGRGDRVRGSGTMPWFLLAVWWLFLLTNIVDSINLPPIHWNQSNPMFKTSNNDHIIEVNINDEIDFVCPHSPQTDEVVDIDTRGEFYIVYQVTKEEYDSCILFNGGRRKNLVVNCSTPKYRKRYTIIFERYSSIPHGQEYSAGGAYYFITTSTGQLEGLDNHAEGACLQANMKLTIKVCCETTTTSTTSIPSTITTRLSSTRRTTQATRTRWKYPTTDLFPSTRGKGYPDKKEETIEDYENEVLPNKEQLVNSAAPSSVIHTNYSMLVLLLATALTLALR